MRAVRGGQPKQRDRWHCSGSRPLAAAWAHVLPDSLVISQLRAPGVAADGRMLHRDA